MMQTAERTRFTEAEMATVRDTDLPDRSLGALEIPSIDPPSPIDLKPGCRFNTRCPFAEDVCRHEEPELRKIGDNHFVACHLVRDGLGPHQRDGEWKV